jgi:hypothetical protein
MCSFCGLENRQATSCNDTEWHQIFIVRNETSKVVASALEQLEANPGVFQNLGPSGPMVYNKFLYDHFGIRVVPFDKLEM